VSFFSDGRWQMAVRTDTRTLVEIYSAISSFFLPHHYTYSNNEVVFMSDRMNWWGRERNFPHMWGDSGCSGCEVMCEEGLPNIWGNAQMFPLIWESRWSYVTLRLLHSEFPCMWGEFDFLSFFYHCGVLLHLGALR